MIEILFLLGFTLHNIEEAIWLPDWSKSAGKFHRKVSGRVFRFTIVIITVLGYLIAFQFFLFARYINVSRFIFCGFVLMMVLNVFFPHLAATIALKKYAPGLGTGVLFNAPLGIYILASTIHGTTEILYLLLSAAGITAFTLGLISILFRIGKTLQLNKIEGNENE